MAIQDYLPSRLWDDGGTVESVIHYMLTSFQ